MSNFDYFEDTTVRDCCTKAAQEAMKTASEKWTARTARAELECERLRELIVRLRAGDDLKALEEADEIVELYIR